MAITKLGWEQAIKNSYDEPSNSLRTTMQNLEVAVELSADDGDSVEARVPLFTGRAVVAAGVDSGTVVAQGDVRYFSEYLVACQSTGVVSSGLHIEIEVSPSDTDDVWHHDSQMIADLNIPSSGFSHIKESTIGPWRRARAKVVYNNFSEGFFVLYVNGR